MGSTGHGLALTPPIVWNENPFTCSYEIMFLGNVDLRILIRRRVDGLNGEAYTKEEQP